MLVLPPTYLPNFRPLILKIYTFQGAFWPLVPLTLYSEAMYNLIGSGALIAHDVSNHDSKTDD